MDDLDISFILRETMKVGRGQQGVATICASITESDSCSNHSPPEPQENASQGRLGNNAKVCVSTSILAFCLFIGAQVSLVLCEQVITLAESQSTRMFRLVCVELYCLALVGHRGVLSRVSYSTTSFFV